MDREEWRFRVTSELRKLGGRARAAVNQPQWNREELGRLLNPTLPDGSADLAGARAALARGDWTAAHRSLASHFSTRPPSFPLDPRGLRALGNRIVEQFPEAAADASQRATLILEGRYDVLGYRNVPFGSPPRWHFDPVHQRTAPGGFWSTVPYLRPEAGDHKIIWEINRHQHWLALARAWHLTGHRRFYKEFVRQLEDWLSANPPLQGGNWASMLEVGFRALSWVWALHFFAGAAATDESADAPWIVDLLVALDRHLAHVEHNLSKYFSPNTHLTGEALALYVAGRALPELRASAHRGDLGRTVLVEEIEHQIGADGGHAELSAHYHRYTTDFYLLALSTARASGDTAAPRFEAAAHRLAAYLRTIADDSGRLPLIGDDDGGKLFPMCPRPPWDAGDSLGAAAVLLGDPRLAVGEIPEEVFWLCGTTTPTRGDVGDAWIRPDRAAWPSTALAASGYYVSRTPQGDHLTFDAGRLGFLNGGHAHADALAMVLTVAGRPLLVDAGTATYTMDPPVRDRFRSTAMHNTVVVNGRSQSEPRGPFHWRTRTDARVTAWRAGEGFDYAEGQHHGYAPISHARAILAVHGVGWFVIDHVFGDHHAAPGPVRVEAFWHLSPEWTAHPESPRCVRLRHPDGLDLAIASSTDLRPLTAFDADGLDAFAPVYGHVERSVCLRTECPGDLPRSFATFVPANAEFSLGISVEALDVQHAPGAGRYGAAYRVTWPGHEAIILSATEHAGNEGNVLWGTLEVRTDARFAFLSVGGDRSPRAILIEGDRLECLTPGRRHRA